ncbi:T9SS type A sorting domain-containing protein [Hyunsoonleella sp. SJ7]|uniref:T9SS type A sorting domain-containing protein n=1 Tax=Hyunsoonleella aquatilis TaxID=2762758 RepID=A0A923KG90_9FLAO|nr:T9SS type A sorting domain-containing protein [Hyunsoonleella aquatilis]MBC3757806.1 T9SS type A sorting domain-containing protein [Hyunsoonleella aquatilis]
MKFNLKLSILMVLMMFFSSISTLHAQHLDGSSCGTDTSSESISILNSYKAQINSFENEFASLKAQAKHSKGFGVPLNSVPVKAHIIRPSDGNGGLSLSSLNEAINDLNVLYAEAYLEFFLCDGINYINDDAFYYNYEKDNEDTLTEEHFTPGVINIYFTNSVEITPGNSLCGYSNTYGDIDVIVMNNICANNGSSLAHEMGHFFSLMHTHGPDNKVLTTELVNGSNCDTDGDMICDTPADPKLSIHNVDSSCEYTGDIIDANGDKFTPDTGNIMSYSRSSCKTHFSPQQLARIYAFYKAARTYLSCPTENVNITADVFSTCEDELTVNFTDLSEGAISWEWDVDSDGVVDYTDQNPSHTFTTGNYDVTLTVTTIPPYGKSASKSSKTLSKTFHQFIQVGMQDDFSINEDFDEFELPSEHGWTANNTSGKGYNWLISRGVSHSKGTGPKNSKKVDGSLNTYIYAEASGAEPGAVATYISPCFNVEYANSEIAFDYHMFGNHVGEFHVDLFTKDGYINDIIPALNGSQQVSSDDPFKTGIVNLASYTNQTLKIRFRAVRGSSWDGDIAIDNISLRTIYVPISDELYTVYPVPARDNILYIKNHDPETVSTYRISNLMGQEFLRGTVTDRPINVSTLSSGTYLLSISDGKTQVLKKIVK